MEWEPRRRLLDEILAENRGNGANFDCVVPVSGGKDGSYVAYRLQNDF